MVRLRRAALLLVTAAVVAGCASGGAAGSGGRVESVGAVTVEVPRGWRASDQSAAAGVVAQESWSPDSGGRLLQVVVGCGDESAQELALAAAQSDRSPLFVSEAREDPDVEMSGLDDAHRTLLTMGGGRADDRETVRLAGLYGSGSGGLVLVEFSTPVATYDRATVDRLFESVRVDTDTLADDCATD